MFVYCTHEGKFYYLFNFSCPYADQHHTTPPNRSMEPHQSINVMLPSVNELTNAMQQIMSSTLAGSTQLNYKFQTIYQLLTFTEHVCIATTRI